MSMSTTAIAFDTLRYADRLRSAGMPEPQAKAAVEALSEALSQAIPLHELATKADLDAARQSLKSEIVALKSEIVALLKAEIEASKADIIRWLAGLMIAQAAVITALVKLL